MKYRPKIGEGRLRHQDPQGRAVPRRGSQGQGHDHVPGPRDAAPRARAAHPRPGGRRRWSTSGRVEIFPRQDGRNMTMVLGPDNKAQAPPSGPGASRQPERRAQPTPPSSDAEPQPAGRHRRGPRTGDRGRRRSRPPAETPTPRRRRPSTPPASTAEPAGHAGPAERRLGRGDPRRRRPHQTGNAMPKMKTHRGAAKRFKITGTGKSAPPQGQPEPHPREEGLRPGSAASAGDRPRPRRRGPHQPRMLGRR